MTFRRSSLAYAALSLSLLVPVATAAQQPSPTGAPTVTALMVEVTINRYRGEKRISSIPFTLAVTPDKDNATLRVGGDIPIARPATGPSKDPDAPPATNVSYRSVGTNIDVAAVPAVDGRYRVEITLEESSVYGAEDAKGATGNAPAVVATGLPAFRTLRANNAVLLKDGQALEFTAATDRISGEVARIAVKLTVVP